MTSRHRPVITHSLIAINVVVFLFTMSAVDSEAPDLAETKLHIVILAATHPELKMQPESQHLVDGFKKSRPEAWAHIQSPFRDIIDAYEAKLKMNEDSSNLH